MPWFVLAVAISQSWTIISEFYLRVENRMKIFISSPHHFYSTVHRPQSLLFWLSILGIKYNLVLQAVRGKKEAAHSTNSRKQHLPHMTERQAEHKHIKHYLYTGSGQTTPAIVFNPLELHRPRSPDSFP